MCADSCFEILLLTLNTQSISSGPRKLRSTWSELISMPKSSALDQGAETGGSGGSGSTDVRGIIEASLRELLPRYLKQALAPEDPNGTDQQQGATPLSPRGPHVLSSSQQPDRAPESPPEGVSASTSTQQLSGTFSFKVPWNPQSPDTPPVKHRGGHEEHDSSPLALLSSRTASVHRHALPKNPNRPLISQQPPPRSGLFSHDRSQVHQTTVSKLVGGRQRPLMTPSRRDDHGSGREHLPRPDDRPGGRHGGGDPPVSTTLTSRPPKPFRQDSTANLFSSTGKGRETHGKRPPFWGNSHWDLNFWSQRQYQIILYLRPTCSRIWR